MTDTYAKLLIVHWEYGPETKHAGGRFWAAHHVDTDGRILDWPAYGIIPLGATEVVVVDGEGTDLLRPIAARTEEINKKRSSQSVSHKPGEQEDA